MGIQRLARIRDGIMSPWEPRPSGQASKALADVMDVPQAFSTSMARSASPRSRGRHSTMGALTCACCKRS
jgi:hypothetical protein